MKAIKNYFAAQIKSALEDISGEDFENVGREIFQEGFLKIGWIHDRPRLEFNFAGSEPIFSVDLGKWINEQLDDLHFGMALNDPDDIRFHIDLAKRFQVLASKAIKHAERVIVKLNKRMSGKGAE